MKPVEIVAILDRSGSMATMKSDAIGGFNSFLAEQQKLDVPANITVVLFDNEYQVTQSCDIQKAQSLNDETFVPRGSTALYDAMGKAFVALELKAPKHAIICVLTDGHENASIEWTQAKIKERVASAEARDWRVVYLAANQDAFAVGHSLGVEKTNIFQGDGNDPLWNSTAYRSLVGQTMSYTSNAARAEGYDKDKGTV